MPPTEGKIVILNGPSSAGKSSIAECLLQQDGFPFTRFSMDDFLNASGGTGDPSVKIREMAGNAAMLLKPGQGVVVDCVAYPKAMDIWLDVLKKHDPLLVAVTAPLDVLEAREKARGNREPGLAREQHGQLFTGTASYTLEIDTSVTRPQEAAALILGKISAPEPVKKPRPKFDPPRGF